MSDSLTDDTLAQGAATGRERMLLDPRHPLLLDDREQVLVVRAGHVDIFAIEREGANEMRRHFLFRQKCASCQFLWPLERCCVVIRPDALKIRLTVDGSGPCPAPARGLSGLCIDRLSQGLCLDQR